jgi:hypothetical protein
MRPGASKVTGIYDGAISLLIIRRMMTIGAGFREGCDAMGE